MMKILIILASGIGNSILFGPTLRALRKNFPRSQIDLFAYKPAFAEPFKGSNLIENIYCYEGIKGLLKLKKQNYNLSITAFPSNRWQFNLFAFLVGAKKRITHSYSSRKISTLSFLQNSKVPAIKTLHDVDQNLNLLRLMKVQIPKEKKLIFSTSKENEKFAANFIKTNKLQKKHLIGVHSGSGPLKYKRVPLAKFKKLVDQNSKRNTVVLIFGGHEEKLIKERLGNSLTQEFYLVDATLKGTAALIKKCNLFITNDTGLMHIASTYTKTKIIALFNGTNYSRTSPYTTNSKIVILKENILKYPFN